MNEITLNGEVYEQCSTSGFVPYTIGAVWYMGEWYKKKEFSFLTEDDQRITDPNAIIWIVSTSNWGKGYNAAQYVKENLDTNEFLKFFSSETAAIKYILENKPSLKIECEDGVVTNPNAIIYSVCTKGQWETREFKASVLDNRQRQVNGFKSPIWMHFTTEQKRKDWIMYNKPVLNYDDIMGLDHARNGTVITILHERLVNLLKQKV